MREKKISNLNAWFVAMIGVIPFAGALLHVLPADAQFYGPMPTEPEPSQAAMVFSTLKWFLVVLVPVVIIIGVVKHIRKGKGS
jgi:putative exporter of polyketide antibiotics